MRVDLPVVTVSHSCPVTWFKAVRGEIPDDWRWHEDINRAGLQQSDAVVSPSASHANALISAYGERKISVVPNASTLPPRRYGKRDTVFAAGRWWEAVDDRCFSLALSNPPYIAGADPHLDALRHEPQLALTPGASGLEDMAEIVAGAPAHLDPGAWLLLEHGHDQAEAVRDLLGQHGFVAIETRRDLAGLPRCTGGRR